MAQKRRPLDETSPSTVELRRALRDLGLRPKKSLGQHFLVNVNVLQSILEASDLSIQDIVVEIGPGLGVLTKEIARRVRQVVAVEVDGRLASALREVLDPFSNVSVVHADILQTDPAILLSRVGGHPPAYKVIADIPYYITAAVLRHFLEATVKPCCMVMMVQREVGEAIVAKPGNMTMLSVSVQFYGKPVIIDYVSSESFYPPPKVDSVILRIDLYEHPTVEVPTIQEFFDVVRAGFSAPRKQLRNALAQGLRLAPSDAVVLLDQAGIDSHCRAESLSLSEWARLCQVVAGNGRN